MEFNPTMRAATGTPNFRNQAMTIPPFVGVRLVNIPKLTFFLRRQQPDPFPPACGFHHQHGKSGHCGRIGRTVSSVITLCIGTNDNEVEGNCQQFRQMTKNFLADYHDALPGTPGFPLFTGIHKMVFLNRIYTKSGDQGETGLGDGHRVQKDHPRVEAYGAVDELNAVMGLLAAYCPDCPEMLLLRDVQNDLFDLGADLCIPLPPENQDDPPHQLRIIPKQAEKLEQAIDRLNETLTPLRSFILPGGSPAAAWLHMARTVCRRAERSVVTLMHSEAVNENVLIYLNRLSDFLFVLGRIANDGGKADVLWVPGKSRA
jgi:cob(I)alamin adenosyltransferase